MCHVAAAFMSPISKFSLPVRRGATRGILKFVEHDRSAVGVAARLGAMDQWLLSMLSSREWVNECGRRRAMLIDGLCEAKVLAATSSSVRATATVIAKYMQQLRVSSSLAIVVFMAWDLELLAPIAIGDPSAAMLACYSALLRVNCGMRRDSAHAATLTTMLSSCLRLERNGQLQSGGAAVLRAALACYAQVPAQGDTHSQAFRRAVGDALSKFLAEVVVSMLRPTPLPVAVATLRGLLDKREFWTKEVLTAWHTAFSIDGVAGVHRALRRVRWVAP